MLIKFLKVFWLTTILSCIIILTTSACFSRKPPVGPVPVDISLNVASTRGDIIDADAESGVGSFGQGNVANIGDSNSKIQTIKDINLTGGTLFISSNAQSLQAQQTDLEVDFEMWVATGDPSHKDNPGIIAVGKPGLTWTAKAQRVTGDTPVYDFNTTIDSFDVVKNDFLDPVIKNNYTAYVRFTLKGRSESYALSLEKLKLNLKASENLKDKTLITPESSSSADAPKILGFEATPKTINKGESSTLRWWVTGKIDNIKIDNNKGTNIGGVPSVIKKDVQPAETTTYTLTATNSAGEVSKSVTVTVANSTPSNFKTLHSLKDSSGDTKAIAYSPDGSLIAAATGSYIHILKLLKIKL